MDHAPRCDRDKFRYISRHPGNCERTDDVRVLLSGVKNGAGYNDTNGIHGSDAVFGGALGLVSLAVDRRPQHATFLSELHAISSSAHIRYPNVTMDSLLAVLLVSPASTELITTEATGGETSWRIFAKTALWQGMNVIVKLKTSSLLTVLAIRTRLADPLVWPGIFVALAWVLPLSWLYHYLTVLPSFRRLSRALDGNAASTQCQLPHSSQAPHSSC